MILYSAGNQKNIIMKVADASVLSNMLIKKPDIIAIPMIISRLQAAGGLINVGNAVDVYLINGTTSNQTVTNNTPNISGATVPAILRARDSGIVAANKSHSQM